MSTIGSSRSSSIVTFLPAKRCPRGTAFRLLSQTGEQLLLLCEQPLCASVQPLTRLGRLDPAPGAIEQLAPEALLERPDLQADRRLGHSELLRRLREAPPLDDGAESSELPRIHISQAYLCV